ncbi:MAG TPA: DUF2971 domain-containing protein [Terracidiphilus sp.]|nr:DUF2971 domain-containing protein [Terracidiphilus sp.]
MEEQEPTENKEQAEPELLYHYTTQEGLLGILGNREKCIWASHLQYLNDASEGQIFAKLFRGELERRATKSSEEPPSQLTMLAQLMGISKDQPESSTQSADIDVLDHGSIAFSWISGQDAFVASFSEKGDLLSQWRAYSGATGGYSIGFARSYLDSVGMHFLESRKESFCNDSNPLVACQYCDPSEEESLKCEITQIVDSYMGEAQKLGQQAAAGPKEELGAVAAIAKKHIFPLGKRRAMTKDHAFQEEAEWRLVFQLETRGTTDSEPEFRIGRSMPIPFFKVDLTWEGQGLEIPEIIVGPCPHPLEAKNSVERLLRKVGVRKFEVRNSKIPYRNW